MDERFKLRHEQVLVKIDKETKIGKLERFKLKVESSSLENKSEVVGLLNDVILKIKSDEVIPRYQKNALLDYLKDQEVFRLELEQVMNIVQ